MRLTCALAIVCCTLSLWSMADEPLPTIDQIYLALQDGRSEEAQRMISRVLVAHPSSAKAHYVQAEVYARAGKLSQARDEFKSAQQLQPDLRFATPRAVAALRAQLSDASDPKEDRVLLASKNGILVAPVVINNAIKLDFFVDSGATDVSIPADLFSSMRRSGAILDGDIIGSRKFINADGEASKSTTFILRTLKIGAVEVSHVEASVAPQRAPLLLGQSFLKRFKSWSIDNASQELILRR
jgi:clan AA aspartic protease (TIGR02281 family)